MKYGVDIIIPIYNAYEEVIKCVDSVKRYTDLNMNRLVLIDDNSSDKRIRSFTDSLKSNCVYVHHNETNHGFSYSVNYGITHSERDVVLLNSDTIVTENWLDKICACAYSDPWIGTVTPFSNSATICSLPVFCKDNSLPKGYTIETYAKLVEKHSLKKYPEIPVAVGFCMYIKRDVIDIVGLFDGETFEKGYGEENDFCIRTQMSGYRHVLCDDTFIYHSGSASFMTVEKAELCDKHDKILRKRYPEYMKEIDRFVAQNPLIAYQKNYQLWAMLENGQKNILYVLHRDFRQGAEDNIGGVQLHVSDLTNAFRNDYNVFVLARDREYMNLTVYAAYREMEMRYYVGPPKKRTPYYDVNFKKLYNDIIDNFAIDMVHIHHFMDLSKDIFDVVHEKRIPLYLTLHDYYMICPIAMMFNEKGEVCTKCLEMQKCRSCLKSQKWYSESVPENMMFIERWRSILAECLQMCDKIYAPSEYAKQIHAMHIPQVAEKIEVIEHDEVMDELIPIEQTVQYYIDETIALQDKYRISGWGFCENVDVDMTEVMLEIRTDSGLTYTFKTIKKDRLDVAQQFKNPNYRACGFIGEIPNYAMDEPYTLYIGIKMGKQISYAKIKSVSAIEGVKKAQKNKPRVAFLGGMNVAKGSQIAYEMITKEHNSIDWYIIGGIGDKDLLFLRQKNLHKTGWYRREDVGNLLKKYKIDLVCLPNRVAETFCYTLSEAIDHGVPVLATNIGALGERVSKAGCGWLMDYDLSSEAYIKKIQSVFANSNEYEAIKKHIAKMNAHKQKSMVSRYAEVYAKVQKRKERHINYVFIMNGFSWASGVDMENGQMASRVKNLETELNAIQNSMGYKALTAWRNAPIPFKSGIKRIMYRVARLFRFV